MTKQQKDIAAAKKLYAGKEFFIKNLNGTLDGPREDIYYVVDRSSVFRKLLKFIQREHTYKFIQVVNGLPVQAFYEDQIVVVQNGK